MRHHSHPLPSCPLQSGRMLEPHLQLWHYTWKTDCSPPHPGFLFCCNKSKFHPLSCTEIPGCRLMAVCPAVVLLVTLPSKSNRAELQNLTLLPVWSARLNLNNSPSCPQCESLWPRQVPSNRNFTTAVKRSNCHGRAFLSLGCCLVLAKSGN